MIDSHGIRPPFLDVGCGVGDWSQYLGAKKWPGLAIDKSVIAIDKANALLSGFPRIEVANTSLSDVNESYQSIF